MTEHDVLTVEGLTVDFTSAGGKVVREVSFSVAAGEIVAIVGESGSGKSVTARAVLGLLPLTATTTGRVRLAGRDLPASSERGWREVRGREVAMVFQEPSTALNPVFPVGWHIAEALRAHRRLSGKQVKAEAVRLLELVGIPEPQRRVHYYPHQLSGGQLQRVVIAMALANDPKLIIADEPTTALDVTVQAEILALLRDLRDRLGTAIVLITHNMGVVADLADRVVVMHQGRIVEQAEVAELFARPARAYTRELLAAVPRIGHRPPDDTGPTGSLALQIRDLVVDYPGRRGRPGFRAVDGVSVHVGRGEVVGLVGESGSGKSTIGRVAAGLLRPSSGAVTVLGQELAALEAQQLRELRGRLGFVFQDPAASLNPLLTVGDCIGEPLRVHRAAKGRTYRRRIGELLDAVRLPAEFAGRYPYELSGGQRQRVVLARALALGPELLIADEPTSALDVTVQASVLEQMSRLQRELGFACLFISHDLAVVDSLAQRVAVLRGGRLVEEGPHYEVLRRPSHPYTQRLIAAVAVPNPAEQRLRRGDTVASE